MRFLLFEALSGQDAEFAAVEEAIPYVGLQQYAHPLLPEHGRLIQTHETFCGPNRKLIYMVRDPRRVVVSQFHHYVRRKDQVIPQNFDDFFDKWLTGEAVPFGRWDRHVNYWMTVPEARGARTCLVRFEDLQKDTNATLRRVLEFLGCIIGAETAAIIVANNSMEKMQAKEDAHFKKWRSGSGDKRFVGSARTANWKETLSDRQERLLVAKFHDTMIRSGYGTSR